MDHAIEIKGLTKHYPGFDLEDVDISVPSGCIMGFVGANGAGKTTTIKSLLGLIRPDKGTIKIFGKDYASEGKAIREDVGVVFDESCFPDGLNAGEISRFMGRIYTRWDAELFQAYMKKFAIPVNKKVKEFSYGSGGRIVSEETSAQMRTLLEGVVAEGSGKNAYVEGYRIGGKTATSQTLPRSANKYISSFVGFAPADDPQILAMCVIYDPQGIYYGGTIAAPVIGDIFRNTFPYLGIEKQ